MPVSAPHFLLTTQSNRQQDGDWRFVLETADGCRYLEVQDTEPALHGERLDLLAIIRGLEAIDQPAHVTLVTSNPSVSRRLDHGLEEWRANGWRWEHHGRMVPVKNSDLWRRVDRAIQIHHVKCRRIDPPHIQKTEAPIEDLPQSSQPLQPPAHADDHLAAKAHSRAVSRRLVPASRRWLRESLTALRVRLAQFGTGLLPNPWLE